MSGPGDPDGEVNGDEAAWRDLVARLESSPSRTGVAPWPAREDLPETEEPETAGRPVLQDRPVSGSCPVLAARPASGSRAVSAGHPLLPGRRVAGSCTASRS